MLLTLKPPQSGAASNEYTVIRQSTARPSPGCESSTGPGFFVESSDKSTSQLSPVTQHAPSVPSPLPPHPDFSQGPEQMQHWLRAKEEEERRIQEEEKTRQETLKLEQRKVEQAILTDALRAGVPPHLVPTIFAGMNGEGRTYQASAAAHQWMAQVHQDAPGPAETQKAFFTGRQPSTQDSAQPGSAEGQHDGCHLTPSAYLRPEARHAQPKSGADSSLSAAEASHVDVSPGKDCTSTTQNPLLTRGLEFDPPAHPDQSQPQAAMNESQPGVLSKTSSYIRTEARSSPSRKRKSTSAHYQAAPQPASRPEETGRSTRSGRYITAPASSPQKAGRPRRQRYRGNAADSDDSRIAKQGILDQEQGQTPRRTAAESAGSIEGVTPERGSVESTRVRITIKSACLTSDQFAQDQSAQSHVVSDAEDAPLDTGMSTRSAGTAGDRN